jgi:hypothetical protein
MTSDPSATMTYVMWREKHPWNVSMLQRVHTPFTILCDFSEPNYSDQLVKENAWKAIGEKMETPAKLCVNIHILYVLKENNETSNLRGGGTV